MRQEILEAIKQGDTVLLSTLLNKITTLDLSNADIGNKEMQVFSQAFRGNKTITSSRGCVFVSSFINAGSRGYFGDIKKKVMC